MAWLYDPSSWVDGVTSAHATDFQHIAADIHAWGGDVNAATHQLTNIGALLSYSVVTAWASTAHAFDLSGGFAHIGGINTTTIPPSDNTNGGLIVGWNRTGGGAEVDLYTAFENPTTAFIFSVKTGASTYADLMAIKGNGYVGLGTITPANPLHIHLGTNLNVLVGLDSGVPYLQSVNDALSTSGPMELIASAVTMKSLGGSITLAIPGLSSSNPGGGTKRIWYDPSDGNRLKFDA